MTNIKEKLWNARCDAWERAKALEEETTKAWQEYEKAKKACEEHYNNLINRKTKSRKVKKTS